MKQNMAWGPNQQDRGQSRGVLGVVFFAGVPVASGDQWGAVGNGSGKEAAMAVTHVKRFWQTCSVAGAIRLGVVSGHTFTRI